MLKPNSKLRVMLGTKGIIVAPFVYDCMMAKIAESVGFTAVYMTGFGASAAVAGLPDAGLLTMTEMVNNARYIASAVTIPVIADADTGYGNPINVWRTVREYEDAGIAAIHIEDQAFPKKCGFLQGKQLVSMEEHVARIRAAVDARRSEDFVIIARTDALAVNGMTDTIERGKAYQKAGADVLFVDGLRTRQEIETVSEAFDSPLLYNGMLITAQEAESQGFKIMIWPGTLFAAYQAIKKEMEDLRSNGTTSISSDIAPVFREFVKFIGWPEIREMESRYGIALTPERPDQ